jgi:arabinofuranan 3-O-arabinosyltransferase
VIRVPRGQTSWVRVRTSSTGVAPLALADVAVPGVTARRQLVLPDLPGGWRSPDLVLLRALRDGRTGCVEVGDRTPCLQERARPSEEPYGFERSLTVPTPRTYPVELTARPVAGEALYAFLQQDLPLNATGSSVAVPDARASGLAAVDGDPGTSWTPRLDDDQPTLALNWLGRATIRGLSLGVSQDAPVRRPTRVLLTWPDGEREVELTRNGRARFDAIRTDRLTLRVLEAENAGSVDPSGIGSRLPPGVGELRLDGLQYERLTFPDEEVEWDCGTGPSVTIDDARRRTRLVAGLEDLYRMRTVTARLCDGTDRLSLAGGRTTVISEASAIATPDVLTLGEIDDAAEVSGAEVTNHSPARQDVVAGDDANYVVLRQNANPGWVAEQDGERLESLVVDGWQQAWRTNGSGHVLRAAFEPDPVYRIGLGVGAGLFVVLLGLMLVSPARWSGGRVPALSPRRLPTFLVAGAAILGGGFLGGLPGVVCAVLGLAVGLAGRRVQGDLLPWTIGSLALAASVAYFVRPWGDVSGWAGDLAWPHYLVVVAVAAVLGAATEPGPQRLRAMQGRSTNRYSTSAARSDSTSVSR